MGAAEVVPAAELRSAAALVLLRVPPAPGRARVAAGDGGDMRRRRGWAMEKNEVRPPQSLVPALAGENGEDDVARWERTTNPYA